MLKRFVRCPPDKLVIIVSNRREIRRGIQRIVKFRIKDNKAKSKILIFIYRQRLTKSHKFIFFDPRPPNHTTGEKQKPALNLWGFVSVSGHPDELQDPRMPSMKAKEAKVVFGDAIQLVNLPAVLFFFHQIKVRFSGKRASVAIVTDGGGFQCAPFLANPKIGQLVILPPTWSPLCRCRSINLR